MQNTSLGLTNFLKYKYIALVIIFCIFLVEYMILKSSILLLIGYVILFLFSLVIIYFLQKRINLFKKINEAQDSTVRSQTLLIKLKDNNIADYVKEIDALNVERTELKAYILELETGTQNSLTSSSKNTEDYLEKEMDDILGPNEPLGYTWFI